MCELIESALITLNGAVTNQAKWAADYFDHEAKTQGIAKLKECDLLARPRDLRTVRAAVVADER